MDAIELGGLGAMSTSSEGGSNRDPIFLGV